MLKFSKNRLEAFSDGVIAIIITIMVLNIPLPDKFELNDIMGLLGSILVFFVTFIVVGSQWINHHHLFDGVSTVSNKIIWRNILYLFFLSLMPIFTKWVMKNPDAVVPAIGYDIVFLLVNYSYHLIWHCLIHENGDKDNHKELEKSDFEGKYLWQRFAIMIVIIVAIIILSFFYPRISLIFFIGLPVTSSMFNLVFENNRDHKREMATNQRKNRKQ